MDDVNSPDKWDRDYARGTDGWDLGRPTPAFQELLSSGRLKPGRIIVPCAGRGYDARLFARNGFRVTAVDFADRPIQEMQRLATSDAPIEILQADMFALPSAFDGSFDYVLEYTCFCAINPQRREQYADLVARLLKPQGIHIHLAFPLDAREGGPPFAVTSHEIIERFEKRGFKLIHRELPGASVSPRRGREELLMFQKKSIRKREIL